MNLYPFQNDLIAKARAALRKFRSVLIQLPTGGGKTCLAAFMIKSAVSKGVNCFFICHRAELILQTALTLSKVGVGYVYISAQHPSNAGTPVQICSIDTLKNRLKGLPSPGLCIWDEAHHIQAKGWGKVKSAFGDCFHIGLTATPSRLDGQGLGDHFDTMVHGPTTKWLIDNAYLSDYTYFAPARPDLSKIHTLAGDYQKDELAEALDVPSITGNIISHWKKHAFGKKTLLFAVSVKHSQNIAEQFRSAGIVAIHMDGNTDKGTRRAASHAFACGDIQILCNVNLFGEGYDLSAQSGQDCTVEAVIDSAPTQSLAMYLQRQGRALRMKPEKAIILDHAGNWARHGFPDDEREWTLEGKKRSGKPKTEEELFVRQCPKCFRVHRPRPTCPECGHVYEAKPREVEEVEGELEEIDREKARLAAKEERTQARSLDQLVELGRKRGYKSPERWAGHVWTARQKKAQEYAGR